MVARAESVEVTESSPPRRRRRFWPFLLALIAILVIAWAAYWYVVYRLADGFIVDAALMEPNESIELGCAERQFGGFPLVITIDCRGARAISADGATADLADLSARAPLYNPGWVEADVVGPFVYDGVNHAVNANWTGGRVDLLAGFDGVSRGKAAFGDLTFMVADRVDDSVWSAAAAAWGTEVAPSSEEEAIRLVLSAESLVVTIGTEAYPTVSGVTSMTLNGFGDTLDRTPERLIGDWLAAGGNFHVDHMDLASGDVVAEVTGPMRLEIDGTLSGNLVVRYSGEEDLPILVAAIFPWLADEAEIIAEAVRLMSRSIEMRGAPAHQARLSFDHGEMAIGLIPLLTIPSVGPLDHYL